jgi:hypothetical protein
VGHKQAKGKAVGGASRAPVDLPSAAAVPPPSSPSVEAAGRWRQLAASLHHNPDLTKAQVRALRAEINALARLRTRWTRTAERVLTVKPGVTLIRVRPPYKERWRERRPGQVRTGGGQNWAFDPASRGKCPACHGVLPHDTFDKRKHHNLMVRVKMPGLKKTWAAMRAGTFRPWERSNARARERGLARRAAVFAAEVPRVAAILGPAKVRAIVSSYSSRHGYTQFRQWVRVHYGTGARRAPGRVGPRDPVTGQWTKVQRAKSLTARASVAHHVT